MSPRPKRTRLATGCKRCRSRHLKCDIDSQTCEHCRVAGAQCDRTTTRFRYGLALSAKEIENFKNRQIWPRIHGKIRFHDETPEIAGFYLTPSEGAKFQLVHEAAENLSTPEAFHNEQQQSRNSLQEQPNTVEDSSPSSVSLCSPGFISLSTNSRTFQPLTEREAILMRNFVENMALWADITDPYRHFESDVPTRALDKPVLRYAIFAFSSRHLNRDTGDSTEALQYHNLCVEILLPELSSDHISEEILTSVAILRQLEEMDGEDNQFHLTGTTHILNTVSIFSSSGGLGEAAAWLCLRQDIYVSLTTQQPLRTNLDNFRSSNIFYRADDFAWSSRIVFLLARVLQNAFSDPAATIQIQHEVEEWYTAKPPSFEPVRVVPRGTNQRFPQIWMLLPVHVIGLQYYHIVRIILELSGCSRSSTYDNLRHSRGIERNVRHHLFTILGLAQSNSRAENTLFTARHSLVSWGWVLRHKTDQRAAESLLHDMHSRTGWNMDGLIVSLRQQWQDQELNHED